MMLAVTIMPIMTLKIVNTRHAVIWCKIPVNCAVHVGEIQLAPTQIKPHILILSTRTSWNNSIVSSKALAFRNHLRRI
jgi:hypothetical protein